jgi:MOSC domain-containing protein YiiM
VDKAVHHYAIDHYPAWIAERPGLTAAFSEPGAFGENISTLGWREETVCIGDRFRMGTALVEISQGRQPCWKLGHRFGDPAMVDRVVKTGRCGWYYRVIEPGMVASGDIIRLVERCHPDWTVARTFRILISTAPTRRDDIAELAGLPQLSSLLPGALPCDARLIVWSCLDRQDPLLFAQSSEIAACRRTARRMSSFQVDSGGVIALHVPQWRGLLVDGQGERHSFRSMSQHKCAIPHQPRSFRRTFR